MSRGRSRRPSELRIRARIGPGGIGMVVPGDAVRVRFPAFDFAQLPPLPGRVRTILPDIAPDAAGGGAHHTALIHLDDTVRLEAAGLRLLPGMPAQADIVAGEKTLLDYLFRPLQHLREGVFMQR